MFDSCCHHCGGPISRNPDPDDLEPLLDGLTSFRLLSDEEVWRGVQSREHLDIPEWIGPVREIGPDGEPYRQCYSGFTEREYYSHAGPGWDYRLGHAERVREQGRNDLSDEPYYQWEYYEEEIT